MDIANRIVFLEARLNRLRSRHEKDNEGVCRKIRREIRNLKKQLGQECANDKNSCTILKLS